MGKTEFKVEGLDSIFNNLERKLGRGAILEASNGFAKKAGQSGAKIVKAAEKGYADTGATVKETTYRVRAPLAGVTYADIGWSGPKQRVKLVHLNEFGYTRRKNGSLHRVYPKGLGSIQRSVNPLGVQARLIARQEVLKILNR